MTHEEASVIIGNIPIEGDDFYTIAEYQEAKAMAVAALLEQEMRYPPIKIIPSDYIYSGETEDCIVYKDKYTGEEMFIRKDELYTFEGYETW